MFKNEIESFLNHFYSSFENEDAHNFDRRLSKRITDKDAFAHKNEWLVQFDLAQMRQDREKSSSAQEKLTATSTSFVWRKKEEMKEILENCEDFNYDFVIVFVVLMFVFIESCDSNRQCDINQETKINKTSKSAWDKLKKNLNNVSNLNRELFVDADRWTEQKTLATAHAFQKDWEFSNDTNSLEEHWIRDVFASMKNFWLQQFRMFVRMNQTDDAICHHALFVACWALSHVSRDEILELSLNNNLFKDLKNCDAIIDAFERV